MIANSLDNKGKGVICKVIPDADAPTDENGNRAEIIVDGRSITKRSNPGRAYEQFYNAASRDLSHKIRKQAGFENFHIDPTKLQVAKVLQDKEFVESAWTQILSFYKMIAPVLHQLLVDDPDHERHVGAVLRDKIYLLIPTDNPVNNLEAANELKGSEYCPHIGPVTYRDDAGNMVTTETKVLIGSQYFILLEKTGEDWSGVASARTNHYGVAAKLNNFDKHTSPGRQAPIRGLGESETRSFIAVVGPEETAALLDRSNSPTKHSHICENIIEAEFPTNIDSVVDESVVPMGTSRPVIFVNHMFACRGTELVYADDNDNGSMNNAGHQG